MRQASPWSPAVRRAAPTRPPGWPTAPMASASDESGGTDGLALAWLIRRWGGLHEPLPRPMENASEDASLVADAWAVARDRHRLSSTGVAGSACRRDQD